MDFVEGTFFAIHKSYPMLVNGREASIRIPVIPNAPLPKDFFDLKQIPDRSELMMILKALRLFSVPFRSCWRMRSCRGPS